jgi:geranylgeranyl diphosphate synthase type 3
MIYFRLDDVQDNSPLRRSHPAAHSVFGMPQVVNSAIYMLMDVFGRATQLGGLLYQQILTGQSKCP